MSKKLINGLKYEKLTQDQLHDLSQWELVDIILAYRKDLKAKKKECEELKETFDGLFKVQYKLADNNKKLRQCITEIKEIAEKIDPLCIYEDWKCTDLDNTVECPAKAKCPRECRNKILQKISEVLE